MIKALIPNELIRDDTKDLVAYAEMGIHPCKFCNPGERPGCAMTCRAWPIWFTVHWNNLRQELER